MSKSTVARGASKAASIWNKIDAAVRAKGGSDNALGILDDEKGLFLVDAIAEVLVRHESKTRNRFLVKVDCAKSLTDMVNAGEYDSIHDDINDRKLCFAQDNGIIETELVMVCLDPMNNHLAGVEDVIKEMKQMGLVPCKIEHLLALGAKHPSLQLERPIICLGSLWEPPLYANRRAPYLGCAWNGRGRALGLEFLQHGVSRKYLFAAMRK